ncbi:MAG: 50S ribosomal protein L11 methyltransferase [Armatimonadetes bacterium]|nr:50S ribosomal protein L11 methyltransferase [Armatimonadota bacterium]
MRWQQLEIECPLAASEAVLALLHRFTGGTVIEDTPVGKLLRTYLPENDDLPRLLDEIRQWLANLPPELLEEGPPTVRESWIQEEDWAHAWKAYFKPLRVGQRLVVKPTWQPWPPDDDPGASRPGDLVIELDPGMAFGTGAHPTTRLCLVALERHLRPGMRVIDLGCGSGLLTVAALKLGAAQVLAVDNDALAVQATRENCQRNGVDGCEVVLADGLGPVRGQWDLIVANISAAVIKVETPRVVERLGPGGIFVCSGFYEGWDDEIAALMREEGLELISECTEEMWGCLHGRKPR